MVDAIIRELVLRKSYLPNEPIQSIYFGGGTPSLLNDQELRNILGAVFENYDVLAKAEITLEANPDDLNLETLELLKAAGINRLSIGIQTFDNERLKFINRAHTSEEGMQSLYLAQQAGFDNITADLIYAIPPDALPYWEHDLNTMLSFNLSHLSIYGLTVEEKTVFGYLSKKGRLHEVKEDTAARQFRLAHELLTSHGYEHYEVSNYAREGKYSKHNSAYWNDQKYLGVGPGAHSYDGVKRAFNISNNAKYLKEIKDNTLPLTVDELSSVDRANEYLLTHLRTQWGINLSEYKNRHGRDLLADHEETLLDFTTRGLLTYSHDHLVLTLEGLMLADEISWRLFYDQE